MHECIAYSNLYRVAIASPSLALEVLRILTAHCDLESDVVRSDAASEPSRLLAP